MSQSLVNEGRFPLVKKRKFARVVQLSGRNPSLMRAGFHIAEFRSPSRS
ncbi:MAG: hypothetical protein ACP5QP_08170 [Brevinematia bacterium]